MLKQSTLLFLYNSIPTEPTPDYPAADGPPTSAAIATRFEFATEAVVAKAEVIGNGGGGAHWYSWSGQRAEAGVSRSLDAIMRRRQRSVVVQRAAAVLFLVSFSVLAANKNKGWAVDDYYRYEQFRYSVSVNVIGFVYSIFQLYATVHHLMKEELPLIRNYFNFAVDQMLANLLISSSSASTARVGDWVSNWVRDPFPNMANSSVAISFLAFLALAFSSLISAFYKLVNLISS